MSTTIRVSDATKRRIAAIADASGRPMTAVVDEAIDALERRVFFDRLNARFGDMRTDEQAWREVTAERAVEEGSIRDRSS